LLLRGIYKESLLAAFVGCRVNNAAYTVGDLLRLFEIADRDRLLAVGPIPAGESFVLYRGVAGVGDARRIRGYFWTISPAVACWFAARAALFGLAEPAVYTATVHRKEMLACCVDRGEAEFICRPTRAKLYLDDFDAIRDRAASSSAA
jgi:hypothetical protein